MVSRITLTSADARQKLSFARFVVGLWRLANWRMNRSERLDYINACLDMGLTTFDHADIYGDYTCEALFGEILPSLPRDKIELITKCGIKLISKNRPEHRIKSYDTSRSHIVQSVENSLKMLQTDYIDLLLIHRPDPLMDADEVVEAFIYLKRTGKVLHFGVSNFTPSQFDLLASRLPFPLVTNQIEISVFELKYFLDGTLDHCQQLRIAPMAWSPLKGGRLFQGECLQGVRLRQTLKQIGATFDEASIDQVALAWLLKHPARIIPILGSGKIERIRNALQAESITLSREQWFMIWSASTGKEVP